MKCPRYCTCFVSYGTYMKTVECIGRQLVNVDLAVPQNVEILDVSNNSISVLEDRAFEVSIRMYYLNIILNFFLNYTS